MNPRTHLKTTEEQNAYSLAYYYKNKEKILEKRRLQYALTKSQTLNDASK